MNKLYALTLVAFVLASSIANCDEVKTATRNPTFQSYLGKQPPELVSDANHWVNGDEKLTLDKLHGKVVWLEFNF